MVIVHKVHNVMTTLHYLMMVLHNVMMIVHYVMMTLCHYTVCGQIQQIEKGGGVGGGKDGE